MSFSGASRRRETVAPGTGRRTSDYTESMNAERDARIDEIEELPEHANAVIGRLSPHAFGIAAGTVLGLAIGFVTIVPALRGELHLADHIGLLSQYLYGFSVTPAGALIGTAYGFVIGYVGGALFAAVRNFGMAVYLRILWRRAEHHMANDLLDQW